MKDQITTLMEALRLSRTEIDARLDTIEARGCSLQALRREAAQHRITAATLAASDTVQC